MDAPTRRFLRLRHCMQPPFSACLSIFIRANAFRVPSFPSNRGATLSPMNKKCKIYQSFIKFTLYKLKFLWYTNLCTRDSRTLRSRMSGCRLDNE